ncbi:CTP synthase C-terminal region-related (seleno)protein [Cohnella panacarvi]|uniref:CTP synthase C-terminal region-related (seleno)protein n=1 Tax=Cohnella panacarvi TaxID=400776 RepID=UPI00047E2B6C|nr:hypothetical protein [Cohnella panacarvi]
MKFAIIGEFDSSFKPHQVTNDAIRHSLHSMNRSVDWNWISTEEVLSDKEGILNSYSGFWIAPGSPYKRMEGALDVIRHCRMNNVPLLGTCGGYQHIVIEYARNVLFIEDAEHAEYDPYASNLVVNKLVCSLAGKALDIKVDKESRTYRIYNRIRIKEEYYCNFGLNPEYQEKLHQAGLKTVGSDDDNESRIVELSNHRFFVGTLFVPQLLSTQEQPHCLITEFLRQVINSTI